MRKLIYPALFLGLLGFLSPDRTGATQQSALKEVMMQKLRASQLLLEGMAQGDFNKVGTQADTLIRLSKTAEWSVRKTPRYELHTNEFRRAAETIAEKARAKNIDGVALGYVDMTLSCVRCHQYVREVQDARLPGTLAPLTALAPREAADGH